MFSSSMLRSFLSLTIDVIADTSPVNAAHQALRSCVEFHLVNNQGAISEASKLPVSNERNTCWKIGVVGACGVVVLSVILISNVEVRGGKNAQLFCRPSRPPS